MIMQFDQKVWKKNKAIRVISFLKMLECNQTSTSKSAVLAALTEGHLLTQRSGREESHSSHNSSTVCSCGAGAGSVSAQLRKMTHLSSFHIPVISLAARGFPLAERDAATLCCHVAARDGHFLHSVTTGFA